MGKIATDLNQSRELAKILPLESADMYYPSVECNIPKIGIPLALSSNIPAWSLSALLDVLPNGTDIVKDEVDTENEKYMCTVGIKDDIICTFGNNSVGACVEMIKRLKERELI